MEKYKETIIWSIVILSIFIGVLIRFPNNFPIQTGHHTFDVAQQILETGTPQLKSEIIYFRAIGYTYTLAGFFYILGVSDFTTKFVGFLFGVGSIFLIYLFTKKISNKKAAIIATILMSLSPWAVRYSAERWYSFYIFFFLLTLYLYYNCLITKDNIRKRYFIILPVIFYITINTTITGTFIMFLFPLIYVFNYKNNSLKIKSILNYILKNKDKIILTFLLFLVFILHYFIMPQRILPEFISPEEYFGSPNLTKFSITNINFSFVEEIFKIYPIESILIFIFLIAILFTNLKYKKESLPFYLLFLMFIVTIIMEVGKSFQPRYLFWLIPIFYICLSIILNYICKIIKNIKIKSIFLIILMIYIINPLDLYHVNSLDKCNVNIKDWYLYSTSMKFTYDSRTPVEYVLERFNPETDLIILGTSGYGSYINKEINSRYAKDIAPRRHAEGSRIAFYEGDYRLTYTGASILFHDDLEKFNILLNSYPRIWLLDSYTTPLNRYPIYEIIENNFKQVYIGCNVGSGVLLYER
ncbi:MAG: ArnT family glycosyltransferase [Candidatus Woesearchaeota archaeon]